MNPVMKKMINVETGMTQNKSMFLFMVSVDMFINRIAVPSMKLSPFPSRSYEGLIVDKHK